MRRAVFTACALGLLLAASVAGEGPGVVVERVEKGFAAERAGLRPDDVLLSWHRAANPPASPQAAQGAISSPFDLWEVELEQAPRGVVTLGGLRGAEGISWKVPPDSWKLEARPRLVGAALAAYEEAVETLGTADAKHGTATLRRLASAAREQNRPERAVWFLFRGATLLVEAKRWEEAALLYMEALAAVDDPATRALLEHRRGELFEEQKRIEEAAPAYQEAFDLRAEVTPESLALAASLVRLGNVAWYRGELSSAEDLYRQALEIQERLAPDSLTVAWSLNNLGLVAITRGELVVAEDWYRRSLGIGEKLAPRSRAVAWSLIGLGYAALGQGDLASGESFMRRALEILERLAPDSLAAASALNNLGIVARRRGDWASAEKLYLRSLEIQQQFADRQDAATTKNLVATLNNLGAVFGYRENLEAAATNFQQALDLLQRRIPNSPEIGNLLNNLGVLARRRGDLEAAEEYSRQVLEIRERDPTLANHLVAALSLTLLGDVARDRGDLAGAESSYRQALEIQERLAPGRLAVANTLDSLGNVAMERDELAAAEGFHRRALAIRELLAPGSADEAQSAHALGRFYRRLNRPEQALSYLRRAVKALESQQRRLGGSEEDRSAFRARHMEVYRDLIDLLVELEREPEAFHVLEQSRARGLLALLSARDLVFTSDIPDELDRDRRLAAVEYDRTLGQLGKLSSEDSAEAKELRERLREIRRRQQRLREQIRAASPRLAALHYPEPLDLEQARAVLGQDTVLLAYSVGAQKSHLFVVEPPGGHGSQEATGLTVVTIPVGEDELRSEVSAFRSRIQETRLESTAPADLVAAAHELYSLLVDPAERSLETADHVLISPDGPLHTLPFAALARSSPAGAEQGRYLAEWKPLAIVLSATLYAELRRFRRRSARDTTLVAFGDPSYPSSPGDGAPAITDPDFLALLKRGYALTPLPGTRQEIRRIAAHFPPPRVTTYLGPEATEERAKDLRADVSYLHFACHALLDERAPLDSSLVLSIPETLEAGRENGLLQAWEIFEGVRLDAELVVLSACSSGLGRELAGEGLIGLSRAFLHAGARSILASLWNVADESTSELMAAFYDALRRGTSKDQALRQAQLRLLRAHAGPEAEGAVWAHPYHWAAFQLTGDRR